MTRIRTIGYGRIALVVLALAFVAWSAGLIYSSYRLHQAYSLNSALLAALTDLQLVLHEMEGLEMDAGGFRAVKVEAEGQIASLDTTVTTVREAETVLPQALLVRLSGLLAQMDRLQQRALASPAADATYADAYYWNLSVAIEEVVLQADAITVRNLGVWEALTWHFRQLSVLGVLACVLAGVSLLLLQLQQRELNSRREAEANLIRAREKAEEAARLKSALLTNMSHEIRTPLTSVIGFSEMLKDSLQGEERIFVDYIHAGGRRLLETLNSVLDLSQLESGAVALLPSDVDLNEEVRSVVKMLLPQSAEKGLEMVVEDAGPPVAVTLDRSALGRVLVNLLSNAVKFTETGGVYATVGREGSWGYVRIRDTGIGIEPAFLPRLFHAFEQESKGLSRSHEGNGLGLCIARRLVDLMGGRIDVASEKGTGTVFTVWLPEARPAPRTEAPPAPAWATGTTLAFEHA